MKELPKLKYLEDLSSITYQILRYTSEYIYYENYYKEAKDSFKEYKDSFKDDREKINDKVVLKRKPRHLFGGG